MHSNLLKHLLKTLPLLGCELHVKTKSSDSWRNKRVHRRGRVQAGETGARGARCRHELHAVSERSKPRCGGHRRVRRAPDSTFLNATATDPRHAAPRTTTAPSRIDYYLDASPRNLASGSLC